MEQSECGVSRTSTEGCPRAGSVGFRARQNCPQVAAEKEAAIAYLTEHVREAAPVPAEPTAEQGGRAAAPEETPAPAPEETPAEAEVAPEAEETPTPEETPVEPTPAAEETPTAEETSTPAAKAPTAAALRTAAERMEAFLDRRRARAGQQMKELAEPLSITADQLLLFEDWIEVKRENTIEYLESLDTPDDFETEVLA